MKTEEKEKTIQTNPLKLLDTFIKTEQTKEQKGEYTDWRFVGYVLDISYDNTTIVTCDAFKKAVGGIPRNSLLIMVPSVFTDEIPLHFTLLRVLDSAPTPLSKDIQETYFELQKRSMPDLDVFTLSELQWGGLKTEVLGMFYPNPKNPQKIEFSGDINNYVSAINYRVYSPDNALLDIIVNSLVPPDKRFAIGKLRLTECQLPLENAELPNVAVQVSTLDLMGTRTAMFGKTRLGKSNVIKIIAQSLIETTRLKDDKNGRSHNVGQIIFDINGEYANDNIQDDNRSLRSGYPQDCTVYAITEKENTPSEKLRLDFYANPDLSHHLIRTFIRQEDAHPPDYVNSFLAVEVPSFDSIEDMDKGGQKRARRKVLIYWAILHQAGFSVNIETIKSLGGVDPQFAETTRREVYGDTAKLPDIKTIEDLSKELRKFTERDRMSRLQSTSKPAHNLFDPDDEALLGFLFPKTITASGTKKIQPFKIYHDPDASNFIKRILESLQLGKTIILDLSNAHPEVMKYFVKWISEEIFAHQVELFSKNEMGDHFIQIYFEEAHNIFPVDEAKLTDIYNRLAKEGAKYQIGMVYSTQSPSTIYKDLLAQTENFFVAHISSRGEVKALANLNVAYDDIQEDILRAKTPGYLRMLTRSNRFVIPIQAEKFSPPETKSGGK
jgi:hypothetical protein